MGGSFREIFLDFPGDLFWGIYSGGLFGSFREIVDIFFQCFVKVSVQVFACLGADGGFSLIDHLGSSTPLKIQLELKMTDMRSSLNVSSLSWRSVQEIFSDILGNLFGCSFQVQIQGILSGDLFGRSLRPKFGGMLSGIFSKGSFRGVFSDLFGDLFRRSFRENLFRELFRRSFRRILSVYLFGPNWGGSFREDFFWGPF